MCHAGPQGEAPLSVRRQKGATEKPRVRPFIVSIGKVRQNRANILGFTSLNNSARPWGIGAVAGDLVPGPGLI